MRDQTILLQFRGVEQKLEALSSVYSNALADIHLKVAVLQKIMIAKKLTNEEELIKEMEVVLKGIQEDIAKSAKEESK